MRTLKRMDLTTLIEPYEGKWVTLTPDGKKVLGASDSQKEALKQAKAKGFTRPYLIKSPSYEMAGCFL